MRKRKAILTLAFLLSTISSVTRELDFHLSPNRRPVKLGTFDNEEDHLHPEKSPEGEPDYAV